MERKELKAISLLLRALLVLIGLACLWQLHLDLYPVRSYYSMMLDPMDPAASVYRRGFVCDLLVCLSVAAVFPGLAVLWSLFRQVGLGRGFYQQKRLRLLAWLAAVETGLLAASDIMMLSFRVDRLGSGFLWGIPSMLDGTMLLYIGLTLGSAALTVVAYALGQSAQKAAALQDENALTV